MPRKPGKPRHSRTDHIPEPQSEPEITPEDLEAALEGVRSSDPETREDWQSYLIHQGYALSEDPEYTALAGEGARDPDPVNRASWVEYLLTFGPCMWEDLERWSLDHSPEVREKFIWSIEGTGTAAGDLCDSDKPRCTAMLYESVMRYGTGPYGIVMWMLSTQSKDWLDLTWATADRMLDSADSDMRDYLFAGYFEHVIPERIEGSQDPRVRPWIEGSDKDRKLMLLEAASQALHGFMGYTGDNLRSIVAELASDPNPEVRSEARAVQEDKGLPDCAKHA